MLKPVMAVSKRNGRTIYNFRWLRLGFDFIKFKSGSFFIQYGKFPIKYFCFIRPKTPRKEFFFLTRRTNKNWVPKRQYTLFNYQIKTGTTAKPLDIAASLKIRFENGSTLCLSSQKHSKTSKREQIRYRGQ